MKIRIGSTTYSAIRNLDFKPEADITGFEVAINKFTVDIKTSNEITPGNNIYLYDDEGTLWAKYWIIDAVQIDRYYVRIDAESVMLLLDRIQLEAEFFEDTTAAAMMIGIFGELEDIYGQSNVYVLDSAFDNSYIDGFAPEQTARQRLQWTCFVLGAYIKSFFSDKIEIRPVSETIKPIPPSKTFWQPSISYGDYVTKVIVKAYTYTEAQGQPATTDKWVEDINGYIYIQTEQEFELENQNVPETVAPKEIRVNDVTLVNSSNVTDILSRLATFYFKRVELDAKVLDAGEYLPGDEVAVNTPLGDVITGFIKSADFIFGNRTGAKIHVAQADIAAVAPLIIIYTYEDEEIDRVSYYLPIGYAYSIETIYPDITEENKRTVYFPENDYATGTIDAFGTVDYEPCGIALLRIKKKLHIEDVDAATDNDGILRIS